MSGIATKGVHAADHLSTGREVVPAVTVSTIYKYDEDPDKLIKVADRDPEESWLGTPYYSRLTHPNSENVEEVVGAIGDAHAVAYSSGLSAIFGAFTHYNPKIVAIDKTYHGTRGITNIFTRLNGLKQISLYDDLTQLGKGDVIYLESPLNPDGVVFDIEHYAKIAHSRGALLFVDSTFAPPPLQDAFSHGADLVIHSATKFFGGHSDLLAGILLTKDFKVKDALVKDRVFLGSNIANLESFLLIRSLRTYELRIKRQSSNATQLVSYLNENKDKFKILQKITHGSLQKDDFVAKQHPNGFSPVFSVELDTEQHAKLFPTKLKYFHHATSLGGVESLIEWRAQSDASTKDTVLRVSIGVEHIDDLIEDFKQALESLDS